MIRLGGKSDNVLVSQVKVLHHRQTATTCGSILARRVPEASYSSPFQPRVFQFWMHELVNGLGKVSERV